VYKVNAKFGDMEWITWKRYSEFHSLHLQLKLPNVSFPKKHMFQFHSTSFNVVNQRIKELGEYLQKTIPLATDSPILAAFLGILENKSLSSIRLENVDYFVSTGSIILFQSSNIGAKLQRKVTHSSWDHVGIIIRRYYYPEILESTGDGVRLYPLALRLETYQKHTEAISIRNPLSIDSIAQKKLIEFARLHEGKPYQLKLFNTTREGYFCSELVADALQYAGLLKVDCRKPCSYWPVSFRPGGAVERHALFKFETIRYLSKKTTTLFIKEQEMPGSN